ncbi:MAG TPA: universal stress protein [Candidatus Binatia bacterium]|nr:universal stress protein [Candidatus Binatia bacterium]
MREVATPANPRFELPERDHRDRLKVYIGFAAGVGKTYRMLQEAHELVERGVDAVVGLVETHGRPATAALLAGLEVVPSRRVEYRGLAVDELDVDAVIARAPQVALIDEVAHTNAPGSKNRRRYQDVQDVVAAGIHVVCAFNVQHVESLKDVVEREIGVRIHETVPDRFLQQADEVVNLDLAVDDLLERLRTGKIYPADEAARALDTFFRESRLRVLRELALREVAESVERNASARARHDDGTARHGAVDGKVMVCLASGSPNATLLLRRGSRMAGRLSSDWYAVYVETAGEAPAHIAAEAHRRLQESIELARELGAEFVRLKAQDPVPALMEFARTHGVGLLITGRSARGGWAERLRGSVVDRLVRAAADVDVHVVAYDPKDAA